MSESQSGFRQRQNALGAGFLPYACTEPGPTVALLPECPQIVRCFSLHCCRGICSGRPGAFAWRARRARVLTSASRTRIKDPNKNPLPDKPIGGFHFGSLAVSYFRTVYLALSSALRRFTVLFGMGRRGTTSLWPPGKALYSLHLTNWKKSSGPSIASLSEQAPIAHVSNTQGYRIKPHGQLVSVSSTHCCACTPDLSTLSSATTLQWG